jgi:hypothetical protein
MRATLQASVIGSAAGSTASPTNANTNLLLYNNSATNYAGIGASVAGDVYIVTGTSAPVSRLVITPAGNVAIGVAAPSYKFHVVGTAAAGSIASGISSGPAGADTTTSLINFTDATVTVIVGAITRNGSNTVAYGTASDERLKEAISESSIGLEELLQIKVRDYNFKNDDRQEHGLIAQEVAAIYPLAVREGGKDPRTEPWMIDYGRLTPLLIKSIQQQQEFIGVLQRRLAEVEARLGA